MNCIGTKKLKIGKDKTSMIGATPEQYNSIIRFADLGQRPFFEIEGMFSWGITLAIPFKLIDIDVNESEKIELSANFYKRADGTSLPHYLSWSPIKSDMPTFIITDYFGDIIIE